MNTGSVPPLLACPSCQHRDPFDRMLIYRRLGGRGRIDVVYRLNQTVKSFALAGIRARHPGYSDTQVERAYARMILGDALARAVWPDRELVDP